MSSRGRHRSTVVWVIATGISIAVHVGLACFLFRWAIPGTAPTTPYHAITLIPIETVQRPASATGPGQTEAAGTVPAPPPRPAHTPQRHGTPVGIEPPPFTGRQPKADKGPEGTAGGTAQAAASHKGAAGPGRIDVWPSKESLDRIALADPHVKNLEAPRPGEFAPPRRYVKDNLPGDLRPDEIGQRLYSYWSPSWNLIKDEGVSTFSTRKAGTLINDWFTAWQEGLKQRDVPDDLHARLPEADSLSKREHPDTAIEPVRSSDAVVTQLEVMPLRDGSWAVRLLQPSGHRLHDRQLLTDAERAVAALAPWKDGFGWVLRFTLTAEFTIIPPVPAVGFTFDEALLTGTFIYPLKKILHKSVTFDGAAQITLPR